VISPGKISQKAIDGAKMTFKQMELINKFTDVCKSLGVPDHECFATVDLYEQQNMNQVITCLAALMRKVCYHGNQFYFLPYCAKEQLPAPLALVTGNDSWSTIEPLLSC